MFQRQRRDSLELLGGLGPEGDDGVAGERSLDFLRQRVDGEPLLLPDVAADGRQFPHGCGRKQEVMRSR